MTKTYNKDEQRVQLERLSDLSTEQKQALADGEQVSLNTLYNYIRGSVVVPALAEAFIEKGAKMLKSKNK